MGSREKLTNVVLEIDNHSTRKAKLLGISNIGYELHNQELLFDKQGYCVSFKVYNLYPCVTITNGQADNYDHLLSMLKENIRCRTAVDELILKHLISTN